MDRKPHVFRQKNANGKNDTKPITYTREYVLREVREMLKTLHNDKEVAGGHRIYYKSQLFANKPYTREQLSRWATRYEEDEKITHAIGKIHEILECRLWVGGLKGLLNATMVKFHLINNYGAREIAKIEVTGKTEHTLLLRDVIRKSKEISRKSNEVDG